MRALDRKLLRDLARLWPQALAIALVLACGVTVIQMSVGMSSALDDTREAYYERSRFAQVFVQARRAPRTLLPEIAAIPGVQAAEARVSFQAMLDVPGQVEAAVGQILSLPETGPPRLNVPILMSGDWPDPDSTARVVVNAPFAEANGMRVGDGFSANLNGRKRWLTITGTALSPEFIYTIGPGALMPDDTRYGILWMSDRAASAAFDMGDAFNDLSLTLARGVDEAPVIDRLDTLLEPYGGQGAYGRDLQQSNAFLDAEITQLKAMALILPPVFLGISVFLVNMVIGRIVALERSEIGLLKAIGYGDGEISLHYMALAALIAAGGIGIGWIFGGLMGRYMAGVYAEFFDFPYLIYRMPPGTYAISGSAALGATLAGAVQSALKAARLPPAVAMAPPAPPRYRRTLMDRALAAAQLSQPMMMVARSLMRWPLRAAATALGLALAVAVLVASSFFAGSLDEIIDSAFYQSNRQDAMLLFADDVPRSALEEVRRLPGVLQAEPQQYDAVILRNGHREKRTAIEARPAGTDLARTVSDTGEVILLPERGIYLAARLAGQLGVGPGDTVEAEFLTGRRETVRLPVAGTVTQYLGMGAFMEIDAYDALHRRAPRMTVANVTLDETRRDAFHGAIKETPQLAAAIFMTENRRSFEATIENNVLVMTSIYAALGILVTVGVAYNSARVQLSERARELASLRILGFTRGEVSAVLVGEILLLALLAQPMGWWIGAAIARAMTEAFASDLYSIPLVLEPGVFAYASLIVLSATAVSLAVVRRRLDRLDLVAVMKTRE
ncbi:ABC transporter permease [Halovulum sp. GXIMD14794]